MEVRHRFDMTFQNEPCELTSDETNQIKNVILSVWPSKTLSTTRFWSPAPWLETPTLKFC